MKQTHMKTENGDIEGAFTGSILTKYLEGVIKSSPIKESIEKITFKLQIFQENGDTDMLEVIDKNKIDFIILVTKLSTMIEMFEVLKFDDNLVMMDAMKEELNRFQEVISKSIEKTNEEFIKKQN